VIVDYQDHGIPPTISHEANSSPTTKRAVPQIRVRFLDANLGLSQLCGHSQSCSLSTTDTIFHSPFHFDNARLIGSFQAPANILANNRTKIDHTPTAITPSEDRGWNPARTQAIITPKANNTPTVIESGLRTNSPQCLHFLASGRISSAQ
jgi:hypothetical protein